MPHGVMSSVFIQPAISGNAIQRLVVPQTLPGCYERGRRVGGLDWHRRRCIRIPLVVFPLFSERSETQFFSLGFEKARLLEGQAGF